MFLIPRYHFCLTSPSPSTLNNKAEEKRCKADRRFLQHLGTLPHGRILLWHRTSATPCDSGTESLVRHRPDRSVIIPQRKATVCTNCETWGLSASEGIHTGDDRHDLVFLLCLFIWWQAVIPWIISSFPLGVFSLVSLVLRITKAGMGTDALLSESVTLYWGEPREEGATCNPQTARRKLPIYHPLQRRAIKVAGLEESYPTLLLCCL